MREARAQDRRTGVYRGVVAELRGEVTRLTVEIGDRHTRADIHRFTTLDARNHASNGVLGPFTGRHQLSVTR